MMVKSTLEVLLAHEEGGDASDLKKTNGEGVRLVSDYSTKIK